MRTLGLVLTGLLVIGVCRADDGPVEEKQTERLKEVLDKWEKATKSVREMHYRFTQTEDDITFQTKTVRTGQVFVKMPELIRIDWTEPGGATTNFVFKDRTVQFFNPKTKEELIVKLPKEYGFPEHPEKYPRHGFFQDLGPWALQAFSERFLQLPLREMQADGLRLTKEDENWIYLELKPRSKRFRDEFKQCIVVLDTRTYRVRMLWYLSINGNTVRLDVEKVDTNPKPAITAESISSGLPKDYKQVNLDDILIRSK